MEAPIEILRGGVSRHVDVMPRVGIAPAAIARWRGAVDRFARETDRADLKDVSRYPAETAYEGENGLLVLCIQFDSGDVLSMQIDASEWRWSRSAPIQ